MKHCVFLLISYLSFGATLSAHHNATLNIAQERTSTYPHVFSYNDNIGADKVVIWGKKPNYNPHNSAIKTNELDPITITLPAKIVMVWNTTRKLKCTVTPSNAHRELSWSSSNPGVVAVSPDGLVKAVKCGEAIVSVRSHNGIEASCKIEVEEPTFCFHIWMKKGNDLQINLTEHPRITYTCGKLIVESSFNRIELDTADVHKFSIDDKSRNRMPEAIQMPQSMELAHLKTAKLQPKLLPSDYDIDTNLSWNSSDPKIVSVSPTGEIKALYPGEAIITVQATNGTEATCYVTVPIPTYYMFVQMRDGRHDRYAFADHPIVKHKDNLLFITSKTGEIHYNAEDVHRITFSDDATLYPTGIEDINEPHLSEGKLHQQADKVRLSGLRPGSKLHIYATDGKLYAIHHATPEGVITISLNKLPKGMFLLKTESITYKIIRK